jgi:hypothetical protein
LFTSVPLSLSSLKTILTRNYLKKGLLLIFTCFRTRFSPLVHRGLGYTCPKRSLKERQHVVVEKERKPGSGDSLDNGKRQ